MTKDIIGQPRLVTTIMDPAARKQTVYYRLVCMPGGDGCTYYIERREVDRLGGERWAQVGDWSSRSRMAAANEGGDFEQAMLCEMIEKLVTERDDALAKLVSAIAPSVAPEKSRCSSECTGGRCCQES